ncbi:MAG: RtcB family protein, partial [Thermoanaerobacterales bacterium]|nr:RtcB family protein [Thermoanaerobacterales bacterium]
SFIPSIILSIILLLFSLLDFSQTTSNDLRSLLDEDPLAYKNIDDVIFTLVDAWLTKPIVRLRPLGVIKGEGKEA